MIEYSRIKSPYKLYFSEKHYINYEVLYPINR